MDTAPKGHGLPEVRPGAEGRESMYRIAYEQGLQTLSDQAAELDGMKTRAVSFMAFIGTATAFLVTTTLRSAQPGTLFYFLAACATVLVALAVMSLLRLINPSMQFTLRLNPRKTIAQWIDRDVPVPSEALLLRGLSGWTSIYIEENESNLKILRRRFTGVVMFGSVGLLIWITAIWVFGRVGVGGS